MSGVKHPAMIFFVLARRAREKRISPRRLAHMRDKITLIIIFKALRGAYAASKGARGFFRFV